MIDTNITWIVVGLLLVAVALAVVAAVALGRRSRARSAELRDRFGPEYDRTVHRYGSRRGEHALQARLRRVEKIRFRELGEAERARFSSLWASTQARFVDDPRGAVAQANDLIKELMRARGYSADDAFEQRAADLSVDHPDVVEHYRAARALADAGTHHGMNTEELRQAVVHYRVLFADLLQPALPAPGMLRPAHA